MKIMLKIAAAAALLAGPALAQGKMEGMDHSKMEGMDHSKMEGMDAAKPGGMAMMKNSAANPYAESEMAMHMKMMAAKGADPAETWTRKMIEHHRGAIAMSRIAVTQAKDAQTRTMAQKTAAMQEKEIAELQGWLKSRGKSVQ